MQVESGVPRLAESMDGLPIDPAVDTLVAKCLEMNPDERFQSMSEFKDAVIRIEERYLLSTSLAANLAETGSVVDKPVNSKFRSVRILFSLIVVCCLITFSTSLFVSRSPSKPNHRPSVRLLRTDSYDVGLNVDSPAFNISLAPSDLDIIPRADHFLVTDADFPKMIAQLAKNEMAQRELRNGRLIKLNLDEHEISGSGFRLLTKLPIVTLTLQATDVTDENLQVLKDFPRLEKVELYYCDDLTNDSMTILSRIPNLKSLMISSKQMDSRSLQAVPSMRKLESLGLKGMEIGTKEARLINELPELYALRVTSGMITKEGYEVLAKNRRIVSLFFDNCEMDEQELKGISQLTQLTQLFFNKVKFTTADVTPLNKLRRLLVSWMERCTGVAPAQVKKQLPPNCKFHSYESSRSEPPRQTDVRPALPGFVRRLRELRSN